MLERETTNETRLVHEANTPLLAALEVLLNKAFTPEIESFTLGMESFTPGMKALKLKMTFLQSKVESRLSATQPAVLDAVLPISGCDREGITARKAPRR